MRVTTEWFDPIWPRFKAAIRAETCVGEEALNGLRTIQLIRAAYLSASRGGQQVQVDCRWPLARLERDDALVGIHERSKRMAAGQ
jgi:hypothetical protein